MDNVCARRLLFTPLTFGHHSGPLEDGKTVQTALCWIDVFANGSFESLLLFDFW